MLCCAYVHQLKFHIGETEGLTERPMSRDGGDGNGGLLSTYQVRFSVGLVNLVFDPMM